jgi:hypothetical protein
MSIAGSPEWAWDQGSYEQDGTVTMDGEDYSVNPTGHQSLTGKSIRQPPTVIVQATTPSSWNWLEKCYLFEPIGFHRNDPANILAENQNGNILACGTLDGTIFSGIVGDFGGFACFWNGASSTSYRIDNYRRTDGKLAAGFFNTGYGYFYYNSTYFFVVYRNFDMTGISLTKVVP